MVVNFKKIVKENKELKKKKKSKKEKKVLKAKVVSKKVLKPNKMTMTIPKQEPYSVLGEPNRFFKNELENEKRSTFFS